MGLYVRNVPAFQMVFVGAQDTWKYFLYILCGVAIVAFTKKMAMDWVAEKWAEISWTWKSSIPLSTFRIIAIPYDLVSLFVCLFDWFGFHIQKAIRKNWETWNKTDHFQNRQIIIKTHRKRLEIARQRQNIYFFFDKVYRIW